MDIKENGNNNSGRIEREIQADNGNGNPAKERGFISKLSQRCMPMVAWLVSAH